MLLVALLWPVAGYIVVEREQNPSWFKMTNCSSRCGQGFLIEQKRCPNKCQNMKMKFAACSQEMCRGRETDFLQMQCSRFDSLHFSNKKYTWSPVILRSEPCRLYCYPSSGKFFSLLSNKVLDNTPCRNPKSGLCINGLCHEYVCQNVKKCHVCPKSRNCSRIDKTILLNDTKSDYRDVILLPFGASDVLVEISTKELCFLALRNSIGEVILNPNWTSIQLNSVKTGEYSYFHYKCRINGEDVESIYSQAPLGHNYFVMIAGSLLNGSMSLNYSYTLGHDDFADPSSVYQWKLEETKECYSFCKKKIIKIHSFCQNSETGSAVLESLCDVRLRPNATQTCRINCSIKWKLGNWSTCPYSCSHLQRMRTVECFDAKNKSVISEKICMAIYGIRESVKNCVNWSNLSCPSWKITEWSKCHQLGKKRRIQIARLECRSRDLTTNISRLLRRTECLCPQPDTIQDCPPKPITTATCLTNTTCDYSMYGCCPDGVTNAGGLNLEKCPHIEKFRQCLLPADKGHCSGVIRRWHYDVKTGRCHRFVYGGCYGNVNNFETLGTCQKSCEYPLFRDRCKMPKSTNIGGKSNTSEFYFYDKNIAQCRRLGNFTASLENLNLFKSLESCQTECPLVDIKKFDCSLPPKPGICLDIGTRFYFELADMKCNKMRGCEGKGNNFATLFECQQYCLPPGVLGFCNLPLRLGDGGKKIERWYFDSKNMKCSKFLYSGCGGNENRFTSEEECSQKCLLLQKIDCFDVVSYGSCDGRVLRYYHKNGKCQPFHYSGCGGNNNNFASLAECQNFCIRHLVN